MDMEKYDVEPSLLLLPVLDLRLLFRELFRVAGAHLRSPGEAGFSPLIGPWRKWVLRNPVHGLIIRHWGESARKHADTA